MIGWPLHGAIILGSSHCDEPTWRSECCDDCLERIWLAPPIFGTLDDLEDAGRPAALLCARCASDRYGPRLAEAIREQTEGRRN